MADTNIDIDTTSAEYQDALSGYQTLRGLLAPRIRLLLELPHDKQLWLLTRDVLLRRYIKDAIKVAELAGMELSE